MCDSHQPEEGADSAPLIFEPKSEPVDPTIARDQAVAYMIEEWLPEATRWPVWRDRAANGGWDHPQDSEAPDAS